MMTRLLIALVTMLAITGAALGDIGAHRTGQNVHWSPLDATQLGGLTIVEADGTFRLVWLNREIAKFDAYQTLKFAAAFPSRKKPVLVLLEAWSGAAACNGDLIAVDVSTVNPVVGSIVSGCEWLEYLWSSDRLIVRSQTNLVSIYSPGNLAVEADGKPDEIRASRGVAAFKKSDFGAAVGELWPIRDRRWAVAPYLLGRMSAAGRGLPKDERLAREYFQAAIALGSPDAAEALARMHDRGQGGSKNAASAAEYRRMAVQLRRSPAGDPFADPQTWRRWVGEWPFERFQGRNLFEVEAIEARLRALLAEDEIAALKRQLTSQNVEIVGNWLRAAGCVPHECTTYLYSAYFELAANGRAVVCIYADLPEYMARRDVVAATGLGTLRSQNRDSLAPGFLCDAWSDDPMKMAEPLSDPRTPPRQYRDPRR